MTVDEVTENLTAPRRMKFEPVVTFGNILSIIAMAGAVMTVYINLQIQLATQAARLTQIEDQMEEMKKLGEAVMQIRVDIATIRALYQSQLGIVPNPSGSH